MASRLVWLAAGVAIGSMASLALAQSPAQTYRVPQFENDEVKVWKTVIFRAARSRCIDTSMAARWSR